MDGRSTSPFTRSVHALDILCGKLLEVDTDGAVGLALDLGVLNIVHMV